MGRVQQKPTTVRARRRDARAVRTGPRLVVGAWAVRAVAGDGVEAQVVLTDRLTEGLVAAVVGLEVVVGVGGAAAAWEHGAVVLGA